jgi:glycosyltransferase 2 family protein
VATALGLAFYADVGDLGRALSDFRWAWFPGALALTAVGYVIRFWRWQLYLARLRIEVPPWRSFWIFMAGQTMVLSPGKVGEVVKSLMLKRSFNVPIRRSAPIVLAERITDGLGVTVVTLIGGAAVASSWPVVAATVVGAGLLVLAVRAPFFDHFAPVAEARAAAGELLRPGLLVGMTLISAAGWFCLCLSVYVCVRGLDLEVSLADSTVAFSVSALAGAITLLPGGLGVTDAGLTGLLRLLADVPPTGAAAATVLARLATLWFAVAFGLVALAVEQRLSRVQGPYVLDSAEPEPPRRSSIR